jgi:hypothetical protein
MAHDLFGAFCKQAEVFRPLLTRPGFEKLFAMMIGWVCTTHPRRSIAAALVAVGG